MGSSRLAARCHLASLLAFFVPAGGVLAAWLMWRGVRRLSAFADEQGKEALNFQITVLLGLASSWLLIFSIVGLITMPLVLILNAVAPLVAYGRVAKGVPYRYPLSWRWIA